MATEIPATGKIIKHNIFVNIIVSSMEKIDMFDLVLQNIMKNKNSSISFNLKICVFKFNSTTPIQLTVSDHSIVLVDSYVAFYQLWTKVKISDEVKTTKRILLYIMNHPMASIEKLGKVMVYYANLNYLVDDGGDLIKLVTFLHKSSKSCDPLQLTEVN